MTSAAPSEPPIAGAIDFTPVTPEELAMATASLESFLRSKVNLLLQRDGDRAVQRRLQEEIGKVKRKEEQLATLRKQGAARARKVDELQETIRKTKALEVQAGRICQTLQETMTKREALTEKMAHEMAEYRLSVQERVHQNIKDILAKCAERATAVEAIEAENAKLEAEVEEKRQVFESAFTRFQSDLKDRTDTFKTQFEEYQQTLNEVGLLETKLALIQREQSKVEMTRHALQEQLEVYQKQFEGFANSTMTPEDVEALAERQRRQAELQIQKLESEKSEAHRMRLQFDKELTELRTKHASMKKEVQQLEKTRTTAEKKCRQAQQLAKESS